MLTSLKICKLYSAKCELLKQYCCPISYRVLPELYSCPIGYWMLLVLHIIGCVQITENFFTDVLHDVCVYLATQSLGTVNPWLLFQHVNNVILPTLRIRGAITDSTAWWWLRSKLGYERKESKKGEYVDGHERPDVIEERKEFVEILNGFEEYVGCIQCPMSWLSNDSDLIYW